MFQNLEVDQTAMNESADRTARSLLPTGIYEAKIKLAYGMTSKGGAMGVVVKFEIHSQDLAKPYEFTNTFYCATKEGKTYWVDKDGGKHNLPDFNHINHLCQLTVGKSLTEMPTEDRAVAIYDFEQKKDVTRTVPVLVDLIDEPIALAFAHVRTNKEELNQSSGKYEKTNEAREFNSVEKMLKIIDGNPFTYDELKAEQEEPSWAISWAEKNTDTVIDRFKEQKSTTQRTAGATRKLGGIK